MSSNLTEVIVPVHFWKKAGLLFYRRPCRWFASHKVRCLHFCKPVLADILGQRLALVVEVFPEDNNTDPDVVIVWLQGCCWSSLVRSQLSKQIHL